MGFVRVHEQEAAKANAILDNAIGKLDSALNNQNDLLGTIKENSDVLSSLIANSISYNGDKISSLKSEIASLKSKISDKAKELDDEAYKDWLASQDNDDEDNDK